MTETFLFPEGEEHRVVVAPMHSDMVDELGVGVFTARAPRLTVRVRARSRTVGSGRPRYVFTGWADSSDAVLAALQGGIGGLQLTGGYFLGSSGFGPARPDARGACIGWSPSLGPPGFPI